MSRYGKGLVCAFAFSLVLACSGVLLGQINLIAPEVEVFEGDRQVEIFWHDSEPESLTYIEQPVLGTVAFPWGGNAGVSSDGFYLGACDWAYSVVVSLLPVGVWEISWREVIDWKTGAQQNRAVVVSELETYYDLSAGIRIKFDDTGVFVPDMDGWSGPQPEAGGLYQGGQAYPDSVVVFTFTCTAGGDLGGGEIGFDWESRQSQGSGGADWVESGSFTVEQAGIAMEITRGLEVTFPAGTYALGESFAIGVLVPFRHGDRFTVTAETFEGYVVLRRSIEDRPDQFKVICNISKCDSFEFFQNEQGEPDPSGERYFVDIGITADQPGVDPNPNRHVVLNGFPYRYTVATYDITEDYKHLFSSLEWQLVYPTVPPAASAANVYVVPNPYVGEAGWEVDGSKISFMNVPEGTVIKIYDVSGGYVNTIYPNRYSYDESLQQGSVDWDLKNADGTKVVSGIYIYKLESKHGEKTGRFIVVR